MVESGRLFGGILQTEPAAPVNLAAVLAVGLGGVRPITPVFESNSLIPASVRYATRFDIQITADMMDNWPWGYAIVVDNPATGLVSVQRLPAIPGQTVRVGDVWTVRSALKFEELTYGNA